jgi:hypothetical protein
VYKKCTKKQSHSGARCPDAMRHLEKWRGLRGRPRVVADHVLDIACAQARATDEISGFGPGATRAPSVSARARKRSGRASFSVLPPELNDPKPGPAGGAAIPGHGPRTTKPPQKGRVFTSVEFRRAACELHGRRDRYSAGRAVARPRKMHAFAGGGGCGPCRGAPRSSWGQRPGG